MKIRDTKGTFHAKMATIGDRNGITEAEDIKKRQQEYTELYKKDLHNPDNHDGVITHLEPDILECEVKWAALHCSHEIKRCLLLGRKVMTNLDHILKSRDIILPTGPSSQGYGFSSGHVWMLELDCEES